MRYFFRAFWRAVYRNPEYLKYSGSWDCRVINGVPVRARWFDLGHWAKSFRNQLFLYRHQEFDQ